MSFSPRFQLTISPSITAWEVRGSQVSNVSEEILLKQDAACKWSRGTFSPNKCF